MSSSSQSDRARASIVNGHVAARLILRGRIQGLGVRPAVARLAGELQLAGTVANTLEGVVVVVQGPSADVDSFRRVVGRRLPAGAELAGIDEMPLEPQVVEGFTIVADSSEGPLASAVPLDRAVCPQCLAEVASPTERRSRYPLTTCAACGPRYSLIHAMPYERADTAMNQFPLCGACQHEYRSANDRRFHAQTIACPRCGPQVWAVDRRGKLVGRGEAAVAAACEALRRGEMVGLRGLGGYQWLCDASNREAVSRLRRLKRRPAKPLAVLLRDRESVEQWCHLTTVQWQVLNQAANPIVLLRLRESGPPRARQSALAGNVHPRLNTLGVMLPGSPLHAVLLDGAARPLVCTSANREGEPLEFEVRQAMRELGDCIDLWLHHDRAIVRPIDDSVVQVVAGRPMTLRLARGLAPLRLSREPWGRRASWGDENALVAVGGHLKAALALDNGRQAILGPHVGDLDSLAGRSRFDRHYDALLELYRCRPARFACDLHPDYYSTTFAQRQAAAHGTPIHAIGHHAAHVAAAMWEHELFGREVLGVAWDGLGIGGNREAWGGEFLHVAPEGTVRRFAHLRAFPLVGGELASREPWRAALATLVDALGVEPLMRAPPGWLQTRPWKPAVQMMPHRRLAIPTTSAGRLFDAAACVILGIDEVGYEAEAAQVLEAVADPAELGSYPFAVTKCRRSAPGPTRESPPKPVFEVDWRPLMAALWEDCRQGAAPSAAAMRFHRSMAAAIVEVLERCPALPVVLVGGVFQNRLLSQLVLESLGSARALLPRRIPPNDGGLAAGQLASVAYSLSVVS